MATTKRKLDFTKVITATGAGLASEFAMDKMQSIKQIQDKPYLAPLAVAAIGAWMTTNPKMEAAGYGMLGASGAQFKTTLNMNGVSRVRPQNGATDQLKEIKRKHLMEAIGKMQGIASDASEPLRNAQQANAYQL